ncbi:amidase signature domain-containing protein [Triangularia verruculosa]|uniref:Amidase signature domain-containing protein n=1 Tax=Triangularia verruculosa TaxID=2587418 RepID=A0AAN7ASQ8_9PEZI|nr:amidase signature domain-containing protein [Triangularia verruculosa]
MASQLSKLAFWRSTSSSSDIPSLLDITLDDIAAGLDSGKFTVLDLVRAYLKRINEVDDHFRSIPKTNSDAEAIAQSLDDEIKTPLHGVPIVFKDCIVTHDMEATSGSTVLLGAKPANESTVAANLRRAGCVILGKAAQTEWQNFRYTNQPTGWTARRGQCTGTFFPNMKASGSSIGSAVATSLGLSFAGVGAETDGSICNPAGKASIVGLKATAGLISRDGVIPNSNRLDALGIMARNVKDAATFLSAMAGKSEQDPLTNEIPFEKIPNYPLSCATSDLKGIKIGVPTSLVGRLEPEEARSFEVAVSVLEMLGATVIHNVALLAEERWRATTRIRTLQDLIDLTKADPNEDYPNHNVESFEIAANLDPASQEFKELEAARDFVKGEGGLQAAMDRNQLDLFVTPTYSDIPGDLITVGPGIP